MRQKIYTLSQQVHEMVHNITNHREMQIIITVRYHLTPVSMTITKKTRDNKKYWRRSGEKGTFLHCW